MTTPFEDRLYLETQLQHWQTKAFDQMVRLVELESQLALTNEKLQASETYATQLNEVVMANEARLDANAVDTGEEVPIHQPESTESPCGCG